MRHLLVTLSLLLTLTGCQDKEQLDTEAQAKHDAKIAAQARAEVLAEIEAEKKSQKKQVEVKTVLQKTETQTEAETKPEDNKTKLDQMGVTMDEGTITIDTNKTKDFFNDLGKKMDIQMKKITRDLEKGVIQTKEAGIDIKDNHINIDLNKTQDLLEDWGKKLQIFANEFDDIAKSLDKNNTGKEFNATN